MEFKYIIYYFLLGLATTLSSFKQKIDRRLAIFTILLSLSLFEELFVEWLISKQTNFYYVYHIFLPVYFGLFAYYLQQYVPKAKFRKYILSTIPFFVVISVVISYMQKNLTSYPGQQLNLAGGLLMGITIIVLLELDITDRVPIYKMTIFWIGIAILFFYGGIFVLNGVYDYLLKNINSTAHRLHDLINISLNYLFYMLVSIGLLCLRPIKKY